MLQVKTGDTVKVYYTGKLKDGTIFDSSIDSEPLEFKIGDGRIIPGFENALIWLKGGDSVSVSIEADDAYGQYDKGLVQDINKDQLPEGLDPQVGQRLEAHQSDGRKVPVIVSEINESSITLDANHPLAGEELFFEIELIEIMDKI
jgi:peptidylprolyl isomerase